MEERGEEDCLEEFLKLYFVLVDEFVDFEGEPEIVENRY